MKFIGVRPVVQTFPDGEQSMHQELTFERNGHRIVKRVKVSGRVRAAVKNSDHLAAEFDRLCEKAAREADRDLAVIDHGDKWREHCEITSPFFGPMERAELLIAFGRRHDA